MKHLFIALVLVGITNIAFAQNNNVFWTLQVKVKMDKKLEWEKKAPVFMKTHYPQFKYRVYEVMTGENSGSYFISMGPMSYKEFDAPPSFPKGEAVMKTDLQMLDALCESTEVNFFRRQDGLSELKPDRKMVYQLVTYHEIVQGSWARLYDLLVKVKEARKLANSKMDIEEFRPSVSGLGNTYTTVRYFEKMEELDLQENYTAAYDAAFGTGDWVRLSEDVNSFIKFNKSELRVLRTDLSTQ